MELYIFLCGTWRMEQADRKNDGVNMEKATSLQPAFQQFKVDLNILTRQCVE